MNLKPLLHIDTDTAVMAGTRLGAGGEGGAWHCGSEGGRGVGGGGSVAVDPG